MENLRAQRPVELPNQDELLRLFDYDPETGELRRRETGHVMRARTPKGYIQAGLNGKVIYAHRIIWKMMTGEEPPPEIDHVDCDSNNNRWSNIRGASRAQNSANRGANKNNSSGFKGVRLHQCGRWVSRITVDRKEIHLGLFDTPEEAHAAYKSAAARHCGEFARAS